jgi:hypothetical protein
VLVEFLRRNWESFFGTECPEGLHIATITSCSHDYGNDLALIFVKSGNLPDYVMKISRSTQYGSKLEREHASLAHFTRNEEVCRVVPRPHYLGDADGKTFFVQQGIPGVSLFRLLIEKGLNRPNRRLLEEALDLLQAINSGATEKRAAEEPPSDRALSLEDSERRKLADRRRQLGGASRLYYLHGDYWPRNLLVWQDRIAGIVDWEFAVPASPLPSDIIWFLVNLGYTLRIGRQPGTPFEDAYRWAFFEPGEHSEVLNRCLRRYFESMSIDRELFVPLLEVSLCGMAQRELESYGRHGKMDAACLSMLRHTLEHETELCVG